MYCVYKDKKKVVLLLHWLPNQVRLRAWGHENWSPRSFGSNLNPISTRGARLCPPYTEYWCPHQVLKATCVPANYLNFHKDNMYIVLKFFLQARGLRWILSLYFGTNFPQTLFKKIQSLLTWKANHNMRSRLHLRLEFLGNLLFSDMSSWRILMPLA